MEELNYRAETCSSPIGETGDYDSWIELVTPNFNLQCYDPNIDLEEVQELADLMNEAKKLQQANVSGRSEQLKAFYLWVDKNYARGMLAPPDEVIEEYLKSL